MLIGMVASQLGIPPEILTELKSTKVEMTKAEFDNGAATLFLRVRNPGATFPVVLSLPIEQLKRIKPVYEKAAALAHAKKT